MFLQWKQKNSIWNWKQHEYIKLMFFLQSQAKKERRWREKVFLWVKSCHIVESKLNNWAKCFGLLLMLLFMNEACGVAVEIVQPSAEVFSEKKSFYIRQTGAHKLLIAIFRDFGWFTNFCKYATAERKWLNTWIGSHQNIRPYPSIIILKRGQLNSGI